MNSIDSSTIPLPSKDLDVDVVPVWTLYSTLAMDCLGIVLPFKEAILEEMISAKIPLGDLHHQPYFLPDLH